MYKVRKLNNSKFMFVFRSARVRARLPISSGERDDSTRSGRHVHVCRQQPGRIQGECRPRPSQGTCSDPLISLTLSLSLSLVLSLSVCVSLSVSIVHEFCHTISSQVHQLRYAFRTVTISHLSYYFSFMKLTSFVHMRRKVIMSSVKGLLQILVYLRYSLSLLYIYY